MNLTIQEKVEMNHQYCDLLTSLILAHYFAEDSDVAVKRCAKQVNKRITNKYVKNVIKGIRSSTSPLEDLNKIIAQIEEKFPLEHFLAIASTQYAQKEQNQ